MADLKIAIPNLRASVVAILGLLQTVPDRTKKGRVKPAKYQVSWGTGFCVVENKYVVTAFHVFNDGKPRNPKAKYYALVVPGNGNPFYTFPVVGFPLERSDLDMAVIEIGPCTTSGISLAAARVSFDPQTDGTMALTMGFAAPQISALNADSAGNFLGGQFFLKSGANEGIIAAQYVDGGNLRYELNIDWHHGESGGPVAAPDDQPKVFSLMQNYRQVQTPNGIIPGPRRGLALSCIRNELEAIGVVGA